MPATYSGLEQEIGGIAPGRFADIVLIDDLERCHVREVLIGGKIVARSGVSEIKSEPIAVARLCDAFAARRSDDIVRHVSRLRAPNPAPRVRVMELVNQTITAERIVRFNASAGMRRSRISTTIC